MNYEELLQDLGLESDTLKQPIIKSPLNTKTIDNTTLSKTPESKNKKIKLVLNINLSTNQTEQLMIYQDEDPNIRVSEFCHIHNLDKNQQNILIQQINGKMNNENQYNSNKKNTSTPIKKQQNYYSTQYQSYSTKESEYPGERLYQLASKQKIQKEEKMRKFKTEKQKEEDEMLSRKPELSKNTKLLIEQVGYRKNGYMRDKGTLKDKQAQQVFLDEQTKECTFHPQINDLSKQMSYYIREKQQQENVFDELYEQARNKMYSQPEQEFPECTFQPQINQNYISNDDFITRMERKEEERKEKMEQIRIKYENIDLKTRQVLFRPKIRRTHTNSFYTEKPVYEKLYEQSALKSKKMQQLVEQRLQEEQELKNQKLKNELSEDIVFLQRKKILKKIFDDIDINKDGLIECKIEELNNLHPIIIQILWPLLKQLQESKLLLDYNDFFDLAYEFCINLSQNDKDKLFKRNIIKDNYKEQYSFTPQTNYKSKQMNVQHYPQCKCEECINQLTKEQSEYSEI